MGFRPAPKGLLQTSHGYTVDFGRWPRSDLVGSGSFKEFGELATSANATTRIEEGGYIRSLDDTNAQYIGINPNVVGGFNGQGQFSECLCYLDATATQTNYWVGPAVFIGADQQSGVTSGEHQYTLLLNDAGGGTSDWQVYRRSDGAWNGLASANGEPDVAGKHFLLRLEAYVLPDDSGVRLKCWKDGKLIIEVVDTNVDRLLGPSTVASHPAYGYPGLSWGNNGIDDPSRWVKWMRCGDLPELSEPKLNFSTFAGIPPIGGFVQGDDARVGNDTTLTATLTNAPKNGNMLIFAVGWHSASATITTPPTGFTLLTTEVGSLASWAWYYKVSDGSETSRSVTISASDTIAIRYNEYEWDNSTPLVSTDEDTTNVSSTTNSQNSGTVTPGRGRNFVVAAIGSSDDVDSQTSQSFSNSFIADDDFIGYGGDTADHRIGRLVNQFGPQTTTHTDTDAGAPMYGAIASFTSIDLPVIESVTTSGSNTAVEPAVVNYPASGIDAGDLLIMLIGNDGSADLPDFPTGDWDDNKLLRTTPSAGGFGMGVSWKIADGTENGGSENVGFSAGVEEWAGAIIHISNWHGSQPPEISTVASENSNDSMAVSLDPSWDAANQGNAWIWFLTGDGGSMNVSSWTTIGAAFPDNQTAYSPGAAAPCAAIATSLETTGTKSKSAGTNDLAVTDPHAELIIGVRGPVSGPVTVDITDVDTDETWDDGSTGLVITGTGFI